MRLALPTNGPAGESELEKLKIASSDAWALVVRVAIGGGGSKATAARRQRGCDAVAVAAWQRRLLKQVIL